MQRRHLNRLFSLVLSMILLASSALGATAQAVRPNQGADPLRQPEQHAFAWQEAPYSVFLPLIAYANPPITRFLALWRNENSAAQRIAHVAIRTQGNTVYVHIWERCPPAYCDWGETTTTVWDAADGTLNLTWDFPLRVETQEITVLQDNRLRVTGHVIDRVGRTTSDYAEFFSPPTPQDLVYSAIRFENLALNQSVFVAGDRIHASGQFVNRSDRTLELAPVAPFNRCTIGGQQQWIERLGADPSIPPLSNSGATFDGRRYAAGGAGLFVWSCTLAPYEARDAWDIMISTAGFPAGNYRFFYGVLDFWSAKSPLADRDCDS